MMVVAGDQGLRDEDVSQMGGDAFFTTCTLRWEGRIPLGRKVVWSGVEWFSIIFRDYPLCL